ncbi:hypothetical protein CVT26_011146 [Gymnopilus dilepis]|uniref:BZIP domain-containing protein n=1 Tax=Gymnopilus dilepis TaxID=231916 RepID=A0A409VJ65_9AGAR|nr:hypothetical protein CVT26_011146 [Gymnopilus dilepis]
MPAANLQGLNIVHPVQESSGDSHDLLGQAYPDLTAQLDLWTHLSFDSEEPVAPRNDDHKKSSVDEDIDDVQSPITSEKSATSSHVNVGGNAPHVSMSQVPGPIPGNLFDINNILAGFNIDAFAAAHAVQLQQQQQQPAVIAPSLAQLLALHPTNNTLYNPGLPHYPAPTPSVPSYTRPSAASTEEAPAKRQRTRKASVTNSESPDGREDNSTQQTSMSAAEDKRRRNTAASARFRLKKKEREAALESKAKELEVKVTELERECEALRRENGWLKGLVVGVTGAAQGQATNSSQGLTVATPPSGPISAGIKRNREDA